MNITDKGAKVSLQIKGKWVAARVAGSARPTANAMACVRLRIAVRNPLNNGAWIVADYPQPVQAYRLRRRDTIIPELDDTMQQQAPTQ